ncbi:hypothetical protein ABIE21_002816 [Conyzicola nivalis]|uniref:Methane oxygenase PmoA n=1 Tax=Conyzicola nivalis TaxID=1477021 RepID=A0ABV2QQQ0_9MICO
MTRFRADDRADGSVAVSIDGVEVLTYVYRSAAEQLESPRPYFHPLRTLAGEVVTQHRPADHVWHAGLAWSLPNVGAHNFWGGPTYVRDEGYVQLPNNGRVDHRGFTAFAADDHGVEIEEQLQWISFDGDPVFTEKRRISVTGGADAWTLVFDTVMRNVTGASIRIGSPSTEGRENAGYGGLFWRGPESMVGGAALVSDGEAAMGSEHPWMAYSADAATVVMVDDRAAPGHSPPWFLRTDDYAGLCPAPFFSEALAVAAGEKVRFRYSVVVADGPSDGARAAALAASATQTDDHDDDDDDKDLP